MQYTHIVTLHYDLYMEYRYFAVSVCSLLISLIYFFPNYYETECKIFKITASIDIFDYTLDLMEVFPVNINFGFVTNIVYWFVNLTISYTLINFLLF